MSTTTRTDNQASMSWGALFVACALIGGITFYPHALIGANGKADYRALWPLMWAMIAGLVRGVGFVPRMRLWRWVFSAQACYACLVVGLVFISGA